MARELAYKTNLRTGVALQIGPVAGLGSRGHAVPADMARGVTAARRIRAVDELVTVVVEAVDALLRTERVRATRAPEKRGTHQHQPTQPPHYASIEKIHEMDNPVRCIVALIVLCGCTSVQSPVDDAEIARRRNEILASNALTSNGLLSNGLLSNGLLSNGLLSNALSTNGLLSNGLLSNALQSTALTAEGHVEGELSRQFLSYVYSCAMPVGASLKLKFGDKDLGTLQGAAGLAPEWGEAGGRCTEHCQAIITACLLARTNFWGVPVKISLRGSSAALQPGAEEKAQYTLREGAYFGNIFVNGGKQQLFACAGPGSNVPQLTRRFCSGGQGQCAIQVRHDCLNPGPTLRRPTGTDLVNTRFACRRQDPNDGSLHDCYTAGVSIYGDDPAGKQFIEPITVYLQAPVAICGDTVCTGDETADSCAADCSTGWARSFGGLNNSPGNVALMPGGDIIVSMVAADTTDLGTGMIKTILGEQSLIVARLSADGQRTIWARAVGYTAANQLRLTVAGSPVVRTTVDAAGNIYVAGEIDGPMWVGATRLPGPLGADPVPPTATFVVALGADGASRWAQQVTGTIDGALIDPSGRPAIVSSGLDEGAEHGVQRLSILATSDGALARRVDLPFVNAAGPARPLELDAHGRLLAATFDGNAFSLHRLDLGTGEIVDFENPGAEWYAGARTLDDGTVIAGAQLAGAGAAIVRFGADGHVVSTQVVTRPANDYQVAGRVVGFAANSRGDAALFGTFYLPTEIDNDVLVPTGYNPQVFGSPDDVWIAKYRADGSKDQAQRMGSTGYDSGHGMLLDESGTSIVTGAFSQTGVFDGRILDHSAGGGETFIVAVPPRPRP